MTNVGKTPSLCTAQIPLHGALSAARHKDPQTLNQIQVAPADLKDQRNRKIYAPTH